jgi:HK97 family phage major capsid protein
VTTNEIRAGLREARTTRERLFGELDNLRARVTAEGGSVDAEGLATLNRSIEQADGRIAELEADYGRMVELERVAGDSRHREDGTDHGEDRDRGHRSGGNQTRDTAFQTIERYHDGMDADAADRIDGMVRSDDSRDWVSRFVNAVGSDAYKSAFAKLIADPQNGHLRFDAAEVAAVREASAIETERSMSIGAGSGGGFLLPFQLDPTVMLSSAGALNPVRQVSRVVTTAWNEWRGISSDGVTVSYSAEAAQMVDGSPVLAQPNIVCQRWTAFVPFSWELGQDWATLESELVRLIADGRDVNDSTMFYSGTTSSNQPNGIISSLGTSQQVITSGTAVYAAGDVWSLKEAVPARFQANASFLAHPTILDKTYRLVPNASTSEPALMETRDGPLVGKPAYEWSSAGSVVATSSTIMIGGDFSAGYVIADRLGMSAVPIQALFGGTAAVHYPTGQAGLAVWGRTGANVVNPNALRVLTVR